MTISFRRRISLLAIIVPIFFILSAFRVHSPINSMLDNYTGELGEGMSISEYRIELIEKARKYIGSRYKYNSSGPKAFDCSGFTSFVYSNFGMALQRSSRDQSKNGKRVPISSAQPGDLVFFAVKGNVHHVGIIIKNEGEQLWMIHSSTSRGVIIEEIFGSAYWRNRLLFVKDIMSELKLEQQQIVPDVVETF
jgi:hypothetical protein